MSETLRAFNAAMGQYQKDVVRWNRQINLVSRQDTLARVAGLIGQCRDAWRELDGDVLGGWSAGDPVWYFDLGSGGGLPGYVWHHLLGSKHPRLETWLVEPREKRAWFLERLNHIAPDKPVRVSNSRWGGGVCELVETPRNILISLKALRLTDSEVMAGLILAAGDKALVSGTGVVIARFYPPKQAWSDELARELGIPCGQLEVSGALFENQRRWVLPPKVQDPSAAALVVSSYIVVG